MDFKANDVGTDPTGRPISHTPAPEPHRLFLHEAGWRVGLKSGSEREFCYMTAPGQDFYHRLQDGEVFLARGDEKLCLACAERRGLLSYEPRGLREPIAGPSLEVGTLDPDELA
jgi:hypothetical protein